MIKKEIRNSGSGKSAKPRLFDAVIDGNNIYLEVKNEKTKVIEKIELKEVLRQIEEARREAE